MKHPPKGLKRIARISEISRDDAMAHAVGAEICFFEATPHVFGLHAYERGRWYRREVIRQDWAIDLGLEEITREVSRDRSRRHRRQLFVVAVVAGVIAAALSIVSLALLEGRVF